MMAWASVWFLPAVTKAESQRPSFVFRADPALDFDRLEVLVRELSPQLRPAQRQAALAEIEVQQTHLYANPTLDAEWATLPVGRTNPGNLDHPYANVPSYAVGVGYTFPIGKRGPRQRRAQASALGAAAEVDLTARENALALADVLGNLATATLRHEGMRELVQGSQHSVELAAARLQAKFGTPLEVDRLSVDVQRTQQLMLSVEADIRESLASCSQLLGSPCESFSDGRAARSYLERWLTQTAPAHPALDQRPDVRALDAYVAASRADRQLAEAEAIPDPTLHVGYVHDRFVISGNQRNSFNVSLSVPLTVFDRGQVHKRAAETAHQQLTDERERRIAAARARIPVLNERLTLQRSRCESLTEQILPMSRAVLSDLEKAVENRLIPLTDVIQARRTVSELLIEEAESCGDAYDATLELIREIPRQGAAR